MPVNADGGVLITTPYVRLCPHQDLMHIQLARPPVNAMDCTVRAELLRHIAALSSDAHFSAIVFTGAGNTFSGGADIREFATGAWPRAHLASVCKALEAYPALIVMGLNGPAMGGGLEIALTADYRVAHPAALLSLPEVRLGLVPGAGGTQRLPRRIDPELALDMIVGGRALSAAEALRCGLIDRIIEPQGDFASAVIQYARELIRTGAARRRCPESPPLPLRKEAVKETRSRKRTGEPCSSARQRCIELVEAACRLPLSYGLALEKSAFDECLHSAEHRGLRHLFLAERAALKLPQALPEVAARPISRVGIIGAGTMGGGIALSCLAAGLRVTIIEISRQALNQGLERIRQSLQASVERKRLSQESARQQLSVLRGAVHYDALADADLVIEAVFEDYGLKERVFGELDRKCRTDCIMASNTSTLDLNRIAGHTSRPANVVGMHFFSPANIMRLLEIVRGTETSADVIRTCQDVAKRLGKVSVVVGVGFGFVGNRMMEPYAREAQRLVLEGASPRQIDGVLERFGMAMGPLAVLDLAGLDVTYRIRESRRAELACDPSYGRLGDELYALGRFGQKSGLGFYRYQGRERQDDPEVVKLADSLAAALGIRRRSIDDQEILERCLFSMINEGARVVEERVATRTSDCDVIYVHGYGFPAWRGGPMHYADEIGIDRVTAALARYRADLGDYGVIWFQESQLLSRLTVSGERLASLDAPTGVA